MSVKGKGAKNASGASRRDERKRTVDEVSKLLLCDVKTGLLPCVRDEFGGHLLTDPSGVRHRGGMTPASGSVTERRNPSSRCEGRSSSGGPARVRVPKRGTGAEPLVVARKRCNDRGAKGRRHPDFAYASTGNGRSA